MKREHKTTNAANSKTMNAVEKDKLFAAATEDEPARIDIKEFEQGSANKKTKVDEQGAAGSVKPRQRKEKK